MTLNTRKRLPGHTVLCGAATGHQPAEMGTVHETWMQRNRVMEALLLGTCLEKGPEPSLACHPRSAMPPAGDPREKLCVLCEQSLAKTLDPGS